MVLAGDRPAFGTGVPVAAAAPTRAATITVYTPDRQEIDVPDGPAGVLVVTDATGPGWTATVDGVAMPVGPVDLAFRGVAVGAGTHRVVFQYAPIATFAGFGLAALALVASGLALAAIRRRDGGPSRRG